MVKAALLSLAILSMGVLYANELIIEVKTDNYPNETTWKLFDYDNNLVRENDSLSKNTTHYDTIQLNSDKCYFWRIYDKYGDGMSYFDAPGDYKIYFDGALVYECEDPNFGDSISVFGLGGACLNYDVSVEELSMDIKQSFSPIDFTFKVLNFGSDTISSLELYYTIKGTNSELITLNNLSIPTGSLVELVLPEPIYITSIGSVPVGLTVTKINGNSDARPENNSMTKNIVVQEGFWKKPLHQVFTSSMCGPCAPANEHLDELLFSYDSSKFALIKYQGNIPSADPYFTYEAYQMMNYYNIGSHPNLYVNDVPYIAPNNPIINYNNEDLDALIEQVTSLKLDIDGRVQGDSVFVEGKIKAVNTSSASVRLRVAVVEKKTTGNVGSNGEKEFYNVFMKFVTNWNGEELGVLAKDQEISFKFSESLAETFIEEKSDLRVVAYLFYDNTTTILQSEMIDVPYTALPPYISFNIENNAVDVNTFPTIEIYSNEALYNTNGTNIIDLSNIVSLTESSSPDQSIAINGSISDDYKTITIQPQKTLKSGIKYVVSIANVMSAEELEINETKIEFTTINTSDIFNSKTQDIKVYPNPAFSNLMVQSQKLGNLIISNIKGEKVLEQSLNPGLNNINISILKRGVYFIKSTNSSGVSVTKFIKN